MRSYRSLVSLLGLVATKLLFGCASDDAMAQLPGGLPSDTHGDSPKVACTPKAFASASEGFFRDISEASGVQVGNFVPNPPKPIPINDHSRLAFADLDGDGLDDVVAHSLFPNAQKGIPFDHQVFLNNGDKTFRDISVESGLKSVQAAFFVFGDVDNDGDQDCFAGLDIDLSGETSALYLNDGQGHFTKKVASGLEGADLASNAVFADFNGDGKLDIYVGTGSSTQATPDLLYFGNGDGTFTDASKNLKNRPVQPTNGLVACDYDDDGDLDVFVSHYGVSIDLGWRALWENDGHGRFTNVAQTRGFHALATGNRYLESTGRGTALQPGDPSQIVGSNGFGIDCQDIDGDGTMDVWLAAISHPVDADLSRKWSDPSMVLLNRGASAGFAFEDATRARKVPFNEGDIDAAAIDFDNDGRIDLSVTRDKKYEDGYSSADQKAWFGLMHQNADGTFTSVGLASGINDPSGTTDRMKAGQNVGWSDIDGDGDLDVLVGGRDNGGQGRNNRLFENLLGERNGWVGIRLRGDGEHVNRDAIGARVTLRMGSKRLVREVKSSRGTYSSADGRALIFGLADEGCVGGTSTVSIDVRWPNGEVRTFEAGSFGLDRYLVIDYVSGLAEASRK